jgi:hypothetical protein
MFAEGVGTLNTHVALHRFHHPNEDFSGVSCLVCELFAIFGQAKWFLVRNMPI